MRKNKRPRGLRTVRCPDSRTVKVYRGGIIM